MWPQQNQYQYGQPPPAGAPAPGGYGAGGYYGMPPPQQQQRQPPPPTSGYYGMPPPQHQQQQPGYGYGYGYGMQWPQQPQQQINPQVQQWFFAVDCDRSGSISPKELKTALSQGGFEFNEHTAFKMVKMFDRDGNGEIDMNEFQQLHNYLMSMKNGFMQIDRDRSGTLDMSEVYMALQKGGYNISHQTLQHILKNIDKQKKGYLTFDEYIDLSIFLGTAKNSFMPLDVNRNGYATFSFEQFLQAASNLQ